MLKYKKIFLLEFEKFLKLGLQKGVEDYLCIWKKG